MKLLAQGLGVLVGACLIVFLLLNLSGFSLLLVLLIASGMGWYVYHRHEHESSLDEVKHMSHQSRESVQARAKQGNLWSKGWNLGGRSKDGDWKDPRAGSAPAFGDRNVDRRPK